MRYRIPDGFINEQHVQEVKNVKKLHFTSQLKDDILNISSEGQVDLYIDISLNIA